MKLNTSVLAIFGAAALAASTVNAQDLPQPAPEDIGPFGTGHFTLTEARPSRNILLGLADPLLVRVEASRPIDTLEPGDPNSQVQIAAGALIEASELQIIRAAGTPANERVRGTYSFLQLVDGSGGTVSSAIRVSGLTARHALVRLDTPRHLRICFVSPLLKPGDGDAEAEQFEVVVLLGGSEKVRLLHKGCVDAVTDSASATITKTPYTIFSDNTAFLNLSILAN